jgi:aryl-alcohol dehydrogenase-like predicted oxidoreductase
MHYRHLGNAGVKVSVIGVGCNRIGRTVDLDGAKAIVKRALDEGINFFDTADIYGNPPGNSETLLGEAFAGLWDRIVVATKVAMKAGEGVNDRGASRYHIMHGVEASLRRLKTDHIDLYYIHEWDAHTPLEETLRALEDLVRGGKVRYIGASNFAAWQLARAQALAELRGWNSIVVTQEEYHMLRRAVEREVIPYARYAKLGIVPYFPLAGGLLTGKYKRGDAISPTRAAYVTPFLTDRNFEILDRLRAFAAERDHTLGELALAWLLAEPQVCSVISGATNADQVSANAKASAWELSAEEYKAVREILEGAGN